MSSVPSCPDKWNPQNILETLKRGSEKSQKDWAAFHSLKHGLNFQRKLENRKYLSRVIPKSQAITISQWIEHSNSFCWIKHKQQPWQKIMLRDNNHNISLQNPHHNSKIDNYERIKNGKRHGAWVLIKLSFQKFLKRKEKSIKRGSGRNNY